MQKVERSCTKQIFRRDASTIQDNVYMTSQTPYKGTSCCKFSDLTSTIQGTPSWGLPHECLWSNLPASFLAVLTTNTTRFHSNAFTEEPDYQLTLQLSCTILNNQPLLFASPSLSQLWEYSSMGHWNENQTEKNGHCVLMLVLQLHRDRFQTCNFISAQTVSLLGRCYPHDMYVGKVTKDLIFIPSFNSDKGGRHMVGHLLGTNVFP